MKDGQILRRQDKEEEPAGPRAAEAQGSAGCVCLENCSARRTWEEQDSSGSSHFLDYRHCGLMKVVCTNVFVQIYNHPSVDCGGGCSMHRGEEGPKIKNSCPIPREECLVINAVQSACQKQYLCRSPGKKINRSVKVGGESGEGAWFVYPRNLGWLHFPLQPRDRVGQ